MWRVGGGGGGLTSLPVIPLAILVAVLRDATAPTDQLGLIAATGVALAVVHPRKMKGSEAAIPDL